MSMQMYRNVEWRRAGVPHQRLTAGQINKGRFGRHAHSSTHTHTRCELQSRSTDADCALTDWCTTDSCLGKKAYTVHHTLQMVRARICTRVFAGLLTDHHYPSKTLKHCSHSQTHVQFALRNKSSH